MDRSRRSQRHRIPTVLLLLIAVGLLSGAWCLVKSGRLSDSRVAAKESTPTSTVQAAQPSRSGFEYLVTEESYVVIQEDGRKEVQQRRRESWRADDGWAWARQTGDEPGRFIFQPYPEWELVTAAPPDALEQQQVLQRAVAGAPVAHAFGAQFNFVVDLLSVETLPAGALSVNHRRALINALALNDSIAVTFGVPDPLGRVSMRVSFVDADYRPDLTQSLYVDQEYTFLGYVAEVAGTDQRGSRIVVERRNVDRIPEDLLTAVGSDRVEKLVWD